MVGQPSSAGSTHYWFTDGAQSRVWCRVVEDTHRPVLPPGAQDPAASFTVKGTYFGAIWFAGHFFDNAFTRQGRFP